MSNNQDGNLFDSLSSLGFDDLKNIDLYSTAEKDTAEKPRVVKKSSPADFVFERKVECPLCYKQISVPSVKTSGIRVLSRDSDFMIHYGEPNPLFYDAWVCTNCGYAALSSRFSIISENQKKLIKENITARWNSSRTYPTIHTVDTAIEKHQLALLNTVVKHGKHSEKAMTCLKLAWLYRHKEDLNNEIKFIEQANLGFISALEKESAPIAGLDEPSVEYLIGELYRRLGDDSNALLWLSRVITSRLAKPRIKEMARDQKSIISEKLKKQKS